MFILLLQLSQIWSFSRVGRYRAHKMEGHLYYEWSCVCVCVWRYRSVGGRRFLAQHLHPKYVATLSVCAPSPEHRSLSAPSSLRTKRPAGRRRVCFSLLSIIIERVLLLTGNRRAFSNHFTWFTSQGGSRFCSVWASGWLLFSHFYSRGSDCQLFTGFKSQTALETEL